MVTVVVCALFMPDTRSQDLETVSAAFGAHRMSDTGVVKALRGVMSWASGRRRRSQRSSVELRPLGQI